VRQVVFCAELQYDKRMIIKIRILFFCFVLIIFGCKSPAPPVETVEPVETIEPVEIVEEIEVIPDTDIIGTWFLGDPRSMIIFQYRPDGTGCEINLNQTASFSLTYRPFNYSLSDNTINISFLDSFRPANSVYDFEKPSAGRLTVINYFRTSSATFIRQEMTALEGLWRRETQDNVDYLFGGRNFMVKLQNGIPTATGNFMVSGTSVTINDLHQCIDYYGLRWSRATAPHENYSFRINDNRLMFSSPGRQYSFVRE